jgi:hypothetical protein
MLSGQTPIYLLQRILDVTYVYSDPLSGYIPMEDTKTDPPDVLERPA